MSKNCKRVKECTAQQNKSVFVLCNVQILHDLSKI